MEVSEAGDLANWMIPKKPVKAWAARMDLVAGVKRVVVVMDHASKHMARASCLLNAPLPLTGPEGGRPIITNPAVPDGAGRAPDCRAY